MKKICCLFLMLICASHLFSQEEKIPFKVRRSVSLLAAHLTQGKTTQLEKATAIHEWITKNIAYNYDLLSQEKYFVGVNPRSVLKAKKAICFGYVELMVALLKEVNIQSESIQGYVHDVSWKPGGKIVEISHCWIGLKINGEWKLADPTWDAGYIGRIPIDKKEYKPKKYFKPLESIKNDDAREAEEKKREEAETLRKERYDNFPAFKNEIGFISTPATDYFLVHVDTFLLTHLPLDPLWQLRTDYISLEDFSLSRDSLILRLGQDKTKHQNFESGIEKYQKSDFIFQYLLNGDRGYEYNTENPGIKAVNYYNFMSLVHNRNIQKIARGSIYEIDESKYPFLKSVNDTIIKFSRSYSTFEKELYKNRKEFDKANFIETKKKDSENSKMIKKIENENEKILNFVKLNSEKIDGDIDRLAEMKRELLSAYPNSPNYEQPSEGLTLEYLNVWIDSMDLQINFLTGIRDTLQKKREQTSYNLLLSDIQSIEYYLRNNANTIQYNTYSNNENIDKWDSLISFDATHALMLYADSLRNEHAQKEVMTAVREATSYIRSTQIVLKQLKAGLKIDNMALYEEYLQEKYYQIIMLALEINVNSQVFNERVLSFFMYYPTISEINGLIETQKEYKEEKNEFIIEQVENSHLRSTSLIQKMKEDSKIWKNKYK